MKTYQRTFSVRFINRVMEMLVRLGAAPKDRYLLTVRGHKSGRLYSTPVTLVEEDGQRWLVAPYGQVSWVKNARAAGQVTLTRGRHVQVAAIVELAPIESAPILKRYLAREPITQPYFECRPESPIEAFIAEAPRHPVFRLLDPARS
jgi:deazaflavin-dependent oxidoreductase (nitroreductase family)